MDNSPIRSPARTNMDNSRSPARTNMDNSPIRDFYEDKTLFITGGTGFVGKVLVEKLLRSTNVKKIYLLIRPKKGVAPAERLEAILSSKMFENLKLTRSTQLAKIVSIPGDVTAPNLGISTSDSRQLAEEVEIVFHSAATVRFDEALSSTLAMNVLGVESVMSLARRMKRLVAVLHVSTAYANCHKKHVEEVIYPSTQSSPREMLEMLDWMPKEALDDVELTSHPNTYTFTKQLAEVLIQDQFSDLPVAIVRPSIVVSAWKEPLPGWVDNLNGPSGLFVLGGKGLMRTARIHVDLLVDIVPVDTCANLLIAAAWNIHQNGHREMEIYNHISGNNAPVTWGDLYSLALEALKRNPLEGMVWYPEGNFRRSWWANKVCEILVHQTPALLADAVSVLRGAKPVATSLCRKMHLGMRSLEYFTTHEWSFSNGNVVGLHDKLSHNDKREFNFSLENISWTDVIENYVKGIRAFVMKSSPATVPACRERLATLRKMHIASQMVFIAGILLMVYFIFVQIFQT